MKTEMLKTILAKSAALALLTVPATAFAQDPRALPDTSGDEDATAPAVDTRTYPNIEFDQSVEPENVWVLDLSNGERVKIRLMDEWAPAHVERIKTLTSQGFYDGVIFHRVIDGFMAQGGDPTGTGRGGESIWGDKFEDECVNTQTFDRPGLLAMANAGPNTKKPGP